MTEATELETAEAEAVSAEVENQETEVTEQIADDGQPEGQEQQETDPPAEDNAAQRNKVPAGKRIRQLTKKFRTVERENEYLKTKLDEIEKRLPAAPEPVRPVRDQFETQEAYEDALFEWRDNTMKTETKQEPQHQVPAELPPEYASFEEELDELSPEAADVVLWGDDWPCTSDMTDYIMSSDNRAALAYHLATHPDVSAAIAKKSPILALRELEKVEASLSSETNNTPPPPPPPADTGKPGGKAAAYSKPYGEDLSADQWFKLRQQGKI